MNAFSKLHPSALLVYFAAVLSVGMFASNPVILLLSFIGAAAGSMLVRTGGEKNSALFLIGLMAVITLTNPLFSHGGRTVIFHLGKITLTLESLLCGASIAVTVAGVMLWFKVFSSVMTSEKFMFLFAGSVPKLSLLVSMSLRFVPLFLRYARESGGALKASGRYSSATFAQKIKTVSAAFSALTGRALENAVETSRSMKARGYGLKGRTDYYDFRFAKSDLLFILFCAVLWGAVLAGEASGKLDFEFYPIITYSQASVTGIVSFAAYACLVLLPCITEAKEMIKWKYYSSKI